ncbi:MAG TPA: hypothetical protein VF712_09830 [Thermoleophilaceae bacterium]|jgi:hypothetical protein
MAPIARVLVIGGAPELEDALAARGHSVRMLPEPADLGSILPELRGVSALAWLGGPELLESLAAKLVDTHVRGFACGPEGDAIAARFGATYGMPTAVIRDGDDAVSAIESLLTA